MNAELAVKMAELEQKIASHDESIQGLFQAIRGLMKPQALPEAPRTSIGFKTEK